MKRTVVCYLVSVGVTALIGFLMYYLTLPAINVHSVGFWAYLLFLGLVYAAAHATARATICKNEISVVG